MLRGKENPQTKTHTLETSETTRYYGNHVVLD